MSLLLVQHWQNDPYTAGLECCPKQIVKKVHVQFLIFLKRNKALSQFWTCSLQMQTGKLE